LNVSNEAFSSVNEAFSFVNETLKAQGSKRSVGTIALEQLFQSRETVTPKLQGYLWDGLLNRSVFLSYVLEIGFLVFMAAIAPKIWK
jgi:hypothetical protein